MTIADFIARCDAFCLDRGVSRVWLSKRLFSDTRKLDQLATDSADVGVRRLEKADADLTVLWRDLQGGSSDVDSDTMPSGANDGAEKDGANISRTEVAA
jgi:hypothetical protein